MFSRCKTAFKNKGINCRILSDNPRISRNVDNSTGFPQNARVIICGGGVMGASVAYHLGRIGWGPETVLIEQSR